MKYTKEEIEKTLETVENDILLKYQDYHKYDYLTIDRMLKSSRANEIKILMKNNQMKKVKQKMIYYSKSDLLEMMIYYFFDDNPYNFLLNLKEMMNYYKDNSHYQIKNIKLYMKLLDFNKLDIKQIKKLFNEYKDIDCATIFYYDYRRSRNIAYRELNNSLLKVNDNITYLDGEKFYLMIHSSSSDLWNDDGKVLSLSLISDQNINHYGEISCEYIYGFSKLKINHIIHMYHADSASSLEFGTNKVQRILSPKKLMEETETYNEIFYKLDKSIRPDLLICYNKVNQQRLMVAKDNNLKIVIINTDKYPKKVGKNKVLEKKYLTNNGYNDFNDYNLLEELNK